MYQFHSDSQLIFKCANVKVCIEIHTYITHKLCKKQTCYLNKIRIEYVAYITQNLH